MRSMLGGMGRTPERIGRLDPVHRDRRQRPGRHAAVEDRGEDRRRPRRRRDALVSRGRADGRALRDRGWTAPATTSGRLQTIEIPGGSQALNRIEAVDIVVDGRRARLFRPTLIGAILLKARSVPVHARPEDERQDLVTLLTS